MLRLLRRASWNLVDQVLSALTNAVLAIVVARSVDDADEFGAFGVAFLVFSFLIGVERALVGQVMGIRHSDETPEGLRQVAGRGLGTIAAFGVLSGLVLIAVGLALGGTLGPPLIAVGVTMAPLLMQDTIRMIFFAAARPAMSALNDAVWAVVQFAAIGVLVTVGAASTWSLTLAWGGAAAVCVALGLVQLRAVPQPSAALEWWRRHRDIVGYLLPETLLTSGGLQVSTLLIGRIVGLAGVAAFRGGQVLLGPLQILNAAVMSFAVPEISRRGAMSVPKRWKVCAVLSTGMGLLSGAYTVAVALMPDVVGTWLLADSWTAAKEVLLPMGLFLTVAGISMGPALIIIAMGQARRTFRIKVVEVPMVLAFMPIGAVLAGASGAAWGQFIAGAVVLPWWFWTLRAALRDWSPAPVPDRPVPGVPTAGPRAA